MIRVRRAAPTQTWEEKLQHLLRRGQGARLGEATIVSRHIHLADVHTPQAVDVLTYLDAGAVLYGRATPGEVIHLDVFHAVAEVDHQRIAAAIRRALAGVEPTWESVSSRILADYFDLCTGTGAGRATGELTYGTPAVRAAHRNHVHLAGRLGDDQLPVLLPLVAAVETEIGGQGVEIRCIERIRHVSHQPGGAPLDISQYQHQWDTLNHDRSPGKSSPGAPSRGTGTGWGAGAGLGTGGAATTEGSLLRTSRGASAGSGWDAQGAAGQPDTLPGSLPHVGSASRSDDSPEQTDGSAERASQPWAGWEQEQRLAEAVALSRQFGSPEELRRVLTELGKQVGASSLHSSCNSQAPYITRQLEEAGLARREIRGLRLTDEGRALAAFLERHLRDVRLRFRKLIRRLPSAAVKRQQQTGSARAQPSPDVRYGPVRGTAPATEGAWLGDVAVPETIRASLQRSHVARIRNGDQEPPRLRVERCDVHVCLRASVQPLNVCLLIDASASMAERRILAAKHLARHLLVSTRDRIAVISFQERDVRVHVPFTRDFGQVEEGLSRIQPMGLTPLAHGLTQSMALIQESKVRRTLLLLITDGIPTVPLWTVDPLADAVEAARRVGKGRIPFGVIGLQPSRRYLEELVRTAGGTLHVVDELNEEALVAIAHQERHKVAQHP